MNKIIKKSLLELSYQTGKYLFPPEFVSLVVTFKCNFRCQTCDIWKKKPEKELSKKEWFKITDQLIQNLDPSAFIEINGGEPLLRKNLVINLVKKLSKKFSHIAINTNGSTITPKILKSLEIAGASQIKLSLYSLKPKIHNKIRGTKIAFKSAKKALRYLTKSKLGTEIAILITSENINSIPELINYLKNFKNISIILQPLDEPVESKVSKSKHISLPKNLWPNKEQVAKLFNFINKNRQNIKNSQQNLKVIKNYYLNPKNALKNRCFAGQRSLIIYPKGDISFCFKMPKIGNLKKDNLEKLLKGSQQNRLIIKKCQKYCRILGCNYSRGIVELFRG